MGSSRHAATLVGGFFCDLSNEELNEWHDFIAAQDVYVQHQYLLDKLEIVLSGGVPCPETYTFAKVVAQFSERQLLQRELFKIAKAWYAGKVAEREKALRRENAEKAERGRKGERTQCLTRNT